MDKQQAYDYLLNKPFSILDYPFGEDVMVFKVKGKMFATLALGHLAAGAKQAEADKRYWWMNLKCDPDEALALRDIFPSVIPGYHMDKRLWNTIILDGSIPQGEIERMMDNSFLLVVAKMSKKDQHGILLHV